MKKFISILTVLLFVFGFSTNFASAAALVGIVYGPSGSVVGTYVPASSILAMFTTTTAVTAGSTITLTFPNNTALHPTDTIESDFTIQESGTASVATAPSDIVIDGNARTIVFTIAAASLSTDTPGVGTFVFKTSSTLGGTEIHNPAIATTSGTFSVQTSVGDGPTSISDVTFIPDAASKVVFYGQPTNTPEAGVAIATQPVVQIQDANGNVITTDNASEIALASFSDDTCTTAKAGLGGTRTMTVVAGEADYVGKGVLSTLAGATYLKATSGSLTSDCSDIVTITPGAKNKLTLTAEPTVGYTYSNFSIQPVVEIQDTYGNKTADTDNVVIAAYSDATCDTAIATDFTGTKTVAAVAGAATFSGIRYDTVTAGGLYLGATSGGLTKDCSSLFRIYANGSNQIITSSGTAATTTTTAPVVTTTTTSAAVTSVPTTLKPVSQMTQTEKNDYVMSLQQFLINLLVQLLNLIKAQKGL
ncbi:MAG: hypothetical protein PHY32_03610 [Candidatus Pacebacteria bacterium]|nr:hypothetical protein [Candidatus Paceibacterota bacterium]